MNNVMQMLIIAIMLAAAFAVLRLCAHHYVRRLDKMAAAERAQEWLDDQW